MSQDKKTLVIVESPTKAETIKRYLDRNYTVVASKGHVRDLPEDRIAIDVENNFQPQYIVSEGKEALIRDLRKKLKSSDELLLATDEDREGESISWHLVELLQPSVPYRRMVFHEITRSAISEALKSGRELDMNLVKAQEDRRIIDRLYGYEVSPVLWKKLSNKKLSGGRVQSAGLRLIVEKELERLNYKSTVYHDIKAEFPSFCASLESVDGERVASGRDFDPVTGEFDNKARILTQEDCQAIISSCRENGKYEVVSVTNRPVTSSPQPPFTTSTLQQAASSKLRLSSKETMRIAQSLFENGFITYMRTDSVNLSAECIDAARQQIAKEFGSQYLSSKVRTFRNKSKNAQEAHEAIRPAGDSFRRPEETGLKGKELALYTLIWTRTIATQMAEAKKSTTSVKLSCGGCIFGASGTTVLFPGYLKAYIDSRDEEEKEEKLPQLEKGDVLADAVLSCQSHTTSAPSRYSEASLIRKLEEQGVGRPSTYAAIISTLLDRGYVREQERMMVPTFTGFAVNACMMSAFSQLVDYSYTSEMEDELDKIASGQEDSLAYLRKFWYGDSQQTGLKAMVEKARQSQEDYKTIVFPHFPPQVTLRDGTQCSCSVKIGPYGAYIATDLKKEDGKILLVNIPSWELPGQMSADDLASLISDAFLGADEGSPDEIVLKKGQRGEYWQKGDRTCSVPHSKKKASDYTKEEIEYLLSLPLTVTSDEEGNEIVLNKGPFGFYLRYKGENYKLYAVPFNMTPDKALEVIGKKKPGSAALKDFGTYLDRPLSIRKGRFGAYVKWGSSNVRLPDSKAPEEYSEEEVRALCDSSVSSSAQPSELSGQYEGHDLSILEGRYGRYIKWNGKNYSIPKSVGEVSTVDQAVQIIRRAEEEKTPSVLGMHNGHEVSLVSGRYGYYLKYNDANYRISQKQAGSLDLAAAVSIIEKQDMERSIKPVSLGQLDGDEIIVSHGRYGYYLKYRGNNIALPSKYKNDVSGLTLDEASLLIRKKI